MELFSEVNFDNVNTARSLYYAVNTVARNFGLRVHTGNDKDTDELFIILSCDKIIDKNACSRYGNGAIFIYKPISDDIQKNPEMLTQVCVPSKLCLRYDRRHPPKKHIAYSIIDGTTLNLYYYNNEWRMGTKHSYDARNLLWRDVIYKEEFDRLLAKNPEFNWDNLDKNRTYSIVMASIKMNPLSSCDNLYFISSQCNVSGAISYDNNTGLCNHKRVIRDGSQQFGTIYRSVDDKGYDYIWRTQTYNKMKTLLYNVPLKDDEYIRRNFKHTDCMILCVLAQGEREFEEKVPNLRDRIIALREFKDNMIQHIIQVCKNEAKPINDTIHDYVKESNRDIEAIQYHLSGLYGVNLLHTLYNELDKKDNDEELKITDWSL